VNKGLRTFLIMLVLFIIVIGGCAYLLTQTGGNEAGNGGGDEGGDSRAMTFADFQAIPLNTNQGDIEADYGPPMAEEELSQAQIIKNPGCEYYRSADPQFGQFYELCFENGILTVKNTL
jgi:hypothetical protein